MTNEDNDDNDGEEVDENEKKSVGEIMMQSRIMRKAWITTWVKNKIKLLKILRRKIK